MEAQAAVPHSGQRPGESLDELIRRYNYEEFVPDKFGPWMRFAESPALLSQTPEHPLTTLADGSATSLPQLCSQHALTVVEFGSFT